MTSPVSHRAVGTGPTPVRRGRDGDHHGPQPGQVVYENRGHDADYDE
ncbi:hypothetical protein GCM10009836_03420 [Pseudonocardia ailaonensis]|uniref:Uncharacterized protein n=1 Tax=Pseudonocardia ailaonensis TaxID=367279 RepID=A0ABN2MIX0_9PSEU